MAASTSIMLTAGGIAALDMILTAPGGWSPERGLPILVGTVGGAFISAGLDRAVPGFGTGIAVVLLVGVLLTSGPKIFEKVNPSRAGFGSAPRQGFGARTN